MIESIPNLNGWIALWCGAGVLFVGLLLFLYKTRTGIIARATTKEAIRQPVFLLLLALGVLLLVLNTYIPFFTLGEDVKMVKDCGLATILIAGLLLAVWTASTSIADEIEGRTAMTLLSKPINRRQFIAGKYVGILTSVLLLMLPLVLVFLSLVFYKVYSYEAAETKTQYDITPLMAFVDSVGVLPVVALNIMQIAVLAAISVAISTRLPMVVNMVTCLTIFVVGHLTTTLVQAGVVRNELVLFVARVIAAVLPALDVYNIEAAIATGAYVPPAYIAWSALYSAAYASIGLLMAFLLFEDRDLA